MANQRMHTGQRLGNYYLIQRLGAGGFAEVYLGEHIHLKSRAAIKVLRTALSQTEAGSISKEAQLLAQLDHLFTLNKRSTKTPSKVMRKKQTGSKKQLMTIW